MEPPRRCERCVLDGVLTKAEVVLKQRDAEIASLPVVGLCLVHYRGLEKIYKDLGWRHVR